MSNTYWNNNWFNNTSTSSSLTYQMPTAYYVSYGSSTTPMARMPEGAPIKPKPEDPMAWLRRRVDEIAWVPA